MKYNTIYAFGENNEAGIRSRQAPVWRGLINIVVSVINSGPNNYYGIDRITVCTGSVCRPTGCTVYHILQNKSTIFVSAIISLSAPFGC